MRILLICGLLGGCATTGFDGPDATETTPPPAPAPATEQSDGFGLHDMAGPIAGMAGFSIERSADATRCGGLAVRIVRDASVAVAPDDQPLADLLSTQYPLGLDFGDATRQQSLRAFDSWFRDAKMRGDAARAAYAPKLEAPDPGMRVVAAARVVQVTRYFAGLLIRAEIPIDMRSSEYSDDKRDAFCDALAEAAKPLLASADETATKCAKVAEGLPAGWWSAVCH